MGYHISCSWSLVLLSLHLKEESLPPVFTAQLWMRNAINRRPCWRCWGVLRPFLWMHSLLPAYPFRGVRSEDGLSSLHPTHRDESLLLASPRMVPWEVEVSALFCQPRVRLSAWARTYQGVCREGGFMGQPWRAPMGPLGTPQAKCTPWFVSRPARGVQEVVSRIRMPLMSSQPWQPLPAPHPRRSPQCSGWMRRPEASLETRHPPTCLVPFPRGETAGQVDLAWH